MFRPHATFPRLLAALLLPAPAAFAVDACQMTPDDPVALSGGEQCSKCEYHLLPGTLSPNPAHKYTIHSDLPEPFSTSGVLYATEPVLPPFKNNEGALIPEEMRTQISDGYSTIDDDFEVFLFHISRPGDGSTPRRLAVYVENNGSAPVELDPHQVMISDGLIGTVHEMESNLGKRVMSGDWDRPLGNSVTIAPGEGKVIAYSKQFSAPRNGVDSSANVNCFGIVRGDVKLESGSKPDLTVYTLGIPGGPVGALDATARQYLAEGAQSAETYIDLLSKPSGCQLRRVIGVYESFIWESEPLKLATNTLPEEGIRFQMAAAQMQTTGCPEAGQTQKMLLHPPYVRSETIGNFMTEYVVRLELLNQDSATPKAVDLRFGKSDADVGLVWEGKIETHGGGKTAQRALSLQTGWAGPKQAEDLETDQRSFLGDEPIVLPPCGKAQVELKFMVLGNSSLPFQIGVHPLASDPPQ